MRQGDYSRDPLEILLDRERFTCKGCSFVIAVFDKQGCAKGRTFGRRCKQYQEKGEDMLRRVRKEEFHAEVIEKPDGLERCLECWVAWLGSNDLGLSAGRMRFIDGKEDDEDKSVAGYESDLYAEQQTADNRIGEATNAMVGSLPIAQMWAIYRKCGVSTQWRFPSMNYLAVLGEAEVTLTKYLKSNVATRILFY